VVRPRVWVIDDSPIIRETIAIVLNDRYDVDSLSASAYARDPSSVQDAGLLVVGLDTLSPASVASLPDVPVLWIEGPGNTPSTTPAQPVLPYPFAPDDLRTRVEGLLAGRGAIHGNRLDIEYPIFPKDAALLARRAAATRFPILICGESGSGKARLARAIHSFGHHGYFLPLAPPHCTPTVLQQTAHMCPGDITLFVTAIDAVTSETEQWLLEIVDRGGFSSDKGWHNVRLICAVNCSLEEIARTHRLSRDLFYRISVFPITLPPLRERTADIPALVQHIAGALASLLRAEPVAFTQRAMDRLVHYLWFGNLAELEAVLTRSVVLADRRTLDAEDLLFGYGRLVPRPPGKTTAHCEPAPTPEANETVDLVINELAHEFKNPMVTIKTVAQHLERLLADETGREQVARLTGEAVDRMDRALENLLQFTRFRAPAAGDVELDTLLSPCLSELAPTLTERRVLLDYRPPEQLAVFVDPAQVTYAFENLLRVIVRDLPEGQTLTVHPVEGAAAVAFEFAGARQPLAGKLAEFLDRPSPEAEVLLPLGAMFAKSLIERNGGRIEVHARPDMTAVTVWLPGREEFTPGNGKAASLNH
jgi:DNA-binding NtrC family response regulator